MITVSHPNYIYLLLVAVACMVVFFAFKKWQKKNVTQLGNATMLAAMLPQYTSKWPTIKAGFILCSLLLLVFAVLGFQKAGEPTASKVQRRDIVFALDLSTSMLATDLQPSRLERAKQLISKYSEQNTNDRIALVVFAGTAYVSVPLTADKEAMRMNLAVCDPSWLPSQGTNLGMALEAAATCFNPKQEGGKIICVLSDGEDHEESIDKARRNCEEKGIVIMAIGMGTAEGSTIPTASGAPKKDQRDEVIVSQLKADVLKDISERGDGEYIEYGDATGTLMALQSAIALQSSVASQENQLVHKQYYHWCAVPAFLLLAAALFFNPKKSKLRL